MSDNDNVTKTYLQFALDGVVQTITTEMAVRLGEVNQRLDRIDTSVINLGKQLVAAVQAISGFTQ